MSFDLFPQEQADLMDYMRQRPSQGYEPGVWHNFVAGGSKTMMQGLAQAGSAVDVAGGAFPVAYDFLTGDDSHTQADKYWAEHEAVFKPAVDYWTPQPGEVGTAGRVAGSVASGLLELAISPALMIGTAGLGTGEELARDGVSAPQAVGASITQAAGAGLGIYLPIFGKTLGSKLTLGAASNIAQGAATREITSKILEGTEAAKQYDPWTTENLVMDGLMGLVFGGLAHLSAGDAAKVNERMTQSERDAILTANQARQMESTRKPEAPADLTAHVDAAKSAINDLLHDREVNVQEGLQGKKFVTDPIQEQFQTQAAAVAHEQTREILGGDAEQPITNQNAGIPPRDQVKQAAFKQRGLLSEIIKAGGISQAEFGEFSMSPKEGSKARPGLFRKNGGHNADSLTEWAIQHGWLYEHEAAQADANLPGGSHDLIRDKVRAALMGETVVHPADLETVLNREEQARMEGELKAQAMEPTHQNMADVDAVARAAKIDEARVERAALMHENDDAAFMAEIRGILHENDKTAFGSGEERTGTPETAAGTRAAKPNEDPASTQQSPLTAAAEHTLENHPDLQIADEAGNPVSAREAIDAARAEQALAKDNANLFTVAAECLLGAM